MSWSTFYSTMAGAAATLLGLVFVAVQLRMERLSAGQSGHWWAIALSAFHYYAGVILISFWLLVPVQLSQLRGAVVLLIVGIGIGRIVVAWIPLWHGTTQAKARPSANTAQRIWWLFAPLGTYL